MNYTIRSSDGADTFEVEWDGHDATIFETTENTRAELTTVKGDDPTWTLFDWLGDDGVSDPPPWPGDVEFRRMIRGGNR